METDYRVSSQNLGVSGSYEAVNTTFGSLINFMPSDGLVQSGKIHTLNVIYSGSTPASGAAVSFVGDIDFIFLNGTVPTSSIGAPLTPFTMSFAETKNILSNVRLDASGSDGPNYSTIGTFSIASVRNLNIPFNCDSLYLASVYQTDTTTEFEPNSVWVSIGYELGASHP